MKKGYIIYTAKDLERNREFAKRFTDYGRDYGLDISILTEDRIEYGIKGNSFYCDVKPCDFAINRTRNHLLAKCLEGIGVKVFNGSEVTRICNDKTSAYLYATGKEIPCLDTYIYKKGDFLRGRAIGFFPCVIKQPASHGGERVFLCEDPSQAIEAARQTEGEYVIAQRLLATEGISDVRVYVLGNEIFAAVKRTAKEGIKANFCQGGEISLYEVPRKLKEYVKRLTGELFFDFAGLDFLTVNDEDFYFNEIEDAVGSRSLCILKNIDTSRVYLDYIKDSIK